MSATIHGLSSLSYTPQADFSAAQSENGGWKATQSIICRTADIGNYGFRSRFAWGVTPQSIDSTVQDYWNFLGLVGLEVQSSEADLSTIVISYSGATAEYNGTGESAEITTYSLSGVISQRPIVEHPKVKALAAAEQMKLGMLLDGEVKYDAVFDRYYQELLTTYEGVQPKIVTFAGGDSSTFAAKIVKGQTTYDAPSFQWTQYKERKDGLTAAQLNLLGKVAVPQGSPPTAAGTRDWKLISATQDFDGMMYRITLVWEMSEDGGWDTTLYT